MAALAGDAAHPLTVDEARALSAASEAKQIPDAALPSIWTRLSANEPVDEAELNPVVDTGLNLAVFAFLGWLIMLTLRRDRV